MPTLSTPGEPPRAAVALSERLSREFLLHHRVCPKSREQDGTLVVAIGPGFDPWALDELAFVYQAAVRTEEATPEALDRLIERLAAGAERAIELARPESPLVDAGDDMATDVRDLANQPPVIRYVNLLVREAYDAGASDIHLEATRVGLTARFRLDGVLGPAQSPPAELRHAVVSRIKLLAELDIAERRRPQDGRIRVRLETRELDLRVSTIPTIFGESVVLRLLDRGGRPVGLDELGMTPPVLAEVERLARRPHGLLLVTGPTGSGKTTTLYAALMRRDTALEKIITVEDPVEYQLPGVTQMPLNRQAGVTFAEALRSILRQDPDTVMVGEMRDGETAAIAVQAAMTGHLVFSTLHTNDAVGAVPRLLDLGVPDYLVSATLDAVLAQRLVRRVCDACRARYRPDPQGIAQLAGGPVGRVELERGVGCPACGGTGFRGRTGLFELLIVTDPLRDAIGARATRSELREIALAGGMQPLRAHGWTAVQTGLTTVEEVLRVVAE